MCQVIESPTVSVLRPPNRSKDFPSLAKTAFVRALGPPAAFKTETAMLGLFGSMTILV